MTDAATDSERPGHGGRILEIGEIGLFYLTLPERTDALYASYRADLKNGRRYLGIAAMWTAVRAARRGKYDLIVLHPPLYPGWHPRSFLAALKFSLFRGRISDTYGAVVSPLLFGALRFVRLPPLVVVDKSDSFGIPRHHHFLFDKAVAYLKRELPVDHWQTLYGSAHSRLPGLHFRLGKRWQRRVAKLRPIALGLHECGVEAALKAYGAEKKTDVFFAGGVAGNSVARAQVPQLIEQLRAAGVSVDFPQERLPFEEFIRRCAQSWLTLSPEGLGWDCYRHVEAAIAGSVPLFNAPTIHRYKPLVVGEQCLVYFPDEDNIVDVVRAALSNKARLRKMAKSAHDHARRHLTDAAVSHDIMRTYGGISVAGI